jgi:hypothetical protein
LKGRFISANWNLFAEIGTGRKERKKNWWGELCELQEVEVIYLFIYLF